MDLYDFGISGGASAVVMHEDDDVSTESEDEG